MAEQPSLRPDEPSSFFPDGRGNRPLVKGTVARGHLRTDLHLFSGTHAEWDTLDLAAALVGGRDALTTAALAAAQEKNYVDTFPFPITRDVLQHGKDRYLIYCVVCHDVLGTGRGKIVERGFTPPPSYHNDYLRTKPVGYLFDVVTRGYGSMPSYRQQIAPRDRWAIVAYVRALQLSQHFPEDKLSDEMRQQLAKSGGRPAP
jgi:mono/diheme cytochrome c family protein